MKRLDLASPHLYCMLLTVKLLNNSKQALLGFQLLFQLVQFVSGKSRVTGKSRKNPVNPLLQAFKDLRFSPCSSYCSQWWVEGMKLHLRLILTAGYCERRRLAFHLPLAVCSFLFSCIAVMQLRQGSDKCTDQ